MINRILSDEINNVNTGDIMVYLISCILNGITPDKKITDKIDLEKLYRFARYHTLDCIVCRALEKTYILDNSENIEIVKSFKESKNKGIRKVMLLDAERCQLINFMEKNMIWYMPLKGVILKEMYPELGMRQMSDNDILFDPAGMKKIHDFMIGRGYISKEYARGNHDAYHKKPIYNFEMHRFLYTDYVSDKFIEYYKEVKKRLIKDEGNDYGYHFSDEDFYVYIITHGYKHYSRGGTGLRTLIDYYVFLNKKEDTMDWKYIRNQVEKLGIAEYEESSRILSKKLFSKDLSDLTQSEKEMYLYYLDSGTYGNIKNTVKSELRKNGDFNGKVPLKYKLKYIKDRVIPNEAHYKYCAPILIKHKWLRPFYIAFRALRMPFKCGKNVINELKYLLKN